jgi:hypothetical protein
MSLHDSASQKPIVVAAHKEFGEKYHVGAALLLAPKLRVLVVGPDKHFAVPFLSLLADGRVERIENVPSARSTYHRVSESTGIYCQQWSPEAPQRLCEAALKTVRQKETDVMAFLARRNGFLKKPAALVWARNEDYQPERNSTSTSISQLVSLVEEVGLCPIVIGRRVADWLPSADNLIEFYKNSLFRGHDSIATQLLMFDSLIRTCGVRVSIGMKSGGMDGPGLFLGLPTVSFFEPNRRSSRRLKQIAKTIKNFFTVALDKRPEKTFREHTQTELDRARLIIQHYKSC